MNEAARPLLSVVALVWNELALTTAFVDSVRAQTDVPYELIVVDNGSEPATAAALAELADVLVRNEENAGFAAGMNQGLERAQGRFVAFCNNDTVVPAAWASRLVEHFDAGGVGIVVPAVTAALRKRNVRDAPGTEVEVLRPFESPPAAVVYVMETETARALGGFGTEYAVASGEDTDLAFKAWVNGLDFVFDTRVLVEHVSKGTAKNLDDWKSLWRANRELFLDKWTSDDLDVPRIPGCDPAGFEYRAQVARSMATWMRDYYAARDKLTELRARRSLVRRIARRLRLQS